MNKNVLNQINYQIDEICRFKPAKTTNYCTRFRYSEPHMPNRPHAAAILVTYQKPDDL